MARCSYSYRYVRIAALVSALVAGSAILSVGVVGSARPEGLGPNAQANTRRVYVSAVDKDGVPVADVVLGDGSKESGGRQDQVVSATMVKVLEGIADELLNQYEVTYTVPDNIKPPTSSPSPRSERD